MSPLRLLVFATAAALIAVGAFAACSISATDDDVFSCSSDGDCAGDGFTCVTGAQGGYCCRPGAEVCDGRDNDCNGLVDDLPPTPCYTGPGGTEGVGECHAGTQTCIGGKPSACLDEVTPTTEVCNGFDDDCDARVDQTFDLTTDKLNCGRCGRACAAGVNCSGGACEGAGSEICNNGVDDDGNTLTDCADPGCLTLGCRTGASNYTCDAQKQCSCNGSLNPPPETACDDHLDNDCDGKVDCFDNDCAARPCGNGCLCGPGRPTETACGDGADNDGDTLTDCADPDCDVLPCGSGCRCLSGAKSENICTDGLDNDGDTFTDCADSDCNAKPCGVGCVCSAGSRKETNCGDNIDNDGDTQTDCADSDCDTQACGTDCQCTGGVKHEMNCADGADNDRDGQTDCADTADCTGKGCLKGGGQPGTCLANGTCQ